LIQKSRIAQADTEVKNFCQRCIRVETSTYSSIKRNAFDHAGILFTLHWEKFNFFLKSVHVWELYGNTNDEQWIVRRKTLLGNAGCVASLCQRFHCRIGLAN
jgi:hypothetical protein